MTWNDANTAELIRLWPEGWSASEIARRIGGLSRNAVIGKVHRIGLPARAVRKAEKNKSKTAKPWKEYARNTKPAPKIKAVVPRLPAEKLPDPNDFDRARLASGSVTLIDLERHHCRWPVGASDLTNHRFCGCQKIDGLPYCEHHAQRAYLPEKPRRLPTEPRQVHYYARVSRVPKVLETA